MKVYRVVTTFLAFTTATLNVAYAQNPAIESVLHSFGTAPPLGGEPNAVIRDSNGDFFGTTGIGGTGGVGVIYKVDSAGHETVLYNFTGGDDGEGPSGGLLTDADGNFYGTTAYGGTGLYGVVFKFDRTHNLTVLYNFTGGLDGASPAGTLVRDPAGNLYGITTSRGQSGAGTVYRLTPAGKLVVLYSFTGGQGGLYPNPGLILDPSGNLYGTTNQGGQFNYGLLYRVSSGGVFQVLYNFTLDAAYPKSGVIRDSEGNLYGTTTSGGLDNFFGVIYKLDSGNRFTTLYGFNHHTCCGYSGLIRDSDGNLFGTTIGSIYELYSNGQFSQLHQFYLTVNGSVNGYYASNGVIRDAGGNLYGSTLQGGMANSGVIFKFSASSQYSVLYRFPDPHPVDGGDPLAKLLDDAQGNLYGTTFGPSSAMPGVVFRLDSSGRETLLHEFGMGDDGAYPWSGVVRDSANNLYGTTTSWGSGGQGVVYRLDPAGQETILHAFTGGADGGNPYAGVTLDASGNLYGAAYLGGTANCGTIYKVDTGGVFTVLYNFTCGADGANPFADLTLGSDGAIYGTAETGGAFSEGVVFRLDTAGNLSVLYSFTGEADGYGPSSLVFDPSGNLYGTNSLGGLSNQGTVFKLDPAGNLTVVYTFTGGTDGAVPTGGVVRDALGNLFGATSAGGAANAGVVYQLDSTGHQTVLYSFIGGTDGSTPQAGLIRGTTGNLFGTTSFGGQRGGGVAFEVHPLNP